MVAIKTTVMHHCHGNQYTDQKTEDTGITENRTMNKKPWKKWKRECQDHRYYKYYNTNIAYHQKRHLQHSDLVFRLKDFSKLYEHGTSFSCNPFIPTEAPQ